MPQTKSVQTGLTMPYSTEAEQAVLGSIMMDNSLANDLIPTMKAGLFYVERHKLIFEAMQSLYTQGNPVDVITVVSYLTGKGNLEKAGGVEYISSLADNLLSAANADSYAEIVRGNSVLRSIIQAAGNIADDARKSNDAHSSLQYAEKMIFDISENADNSDLVQIGEASSDKISSIQRIQQGNMEEVGLSTGFKNLDAFIGGLRPGTYNLIAARPACGKTAFALNIALKAALDLDKTVAIFNFEMSAKEIVGRMLTTISGVSQTKQEKPHSLAPSEIHKLFGAHAKLCSSKIFVDDSALNTPTKILSKCRKLKIKQGKLDLVIVDYLQLMSISDKGGSNDMARQQEVSQMSRLMKVFAKELKVPMLVLCQLNRAAELRPGYTEPKLSDLRESGSIEQDADTIMFLQRYKAEDDKGKPISPAYTQQNVIELFLQKNRHGRTGKAAYEFLGDVQTFVPIKAVDASVAMSLVSKEEKAPVITESTVKTAQNEDKAPVRLKEINDEFSPFSDAPASEAASEGDLKPVAETADFEETSYYSDSGYDDYPSADEAVSAQEDDGKIPF